MMLKINHYEVTFCPLVKLETGYCVSDIADMVVIEDTRKLSPISIHNHIRKSYAKKHGEDPGYLVITEIKQSAVIKEYQEVK